MGIAIGDAIENRYVLDLPRGETGSGPEWQAIDMLLHRRVIVVLGRRPAVAADGNLGDDDATAPLPIPVSNGRRVLDGGVYDGRAYLVVEFDQPARVSESAENRIAPMAALAGPGPAIRTSGRFVGRPVDDFDTSTDLTPVTAPTGRHVPTNWANPDAGAARRSRSTVAFRVIGGLTALAAAVILVFFVMARDPDTGPASADTAPATTVAPAPSDPSAGREGLPLPVNESPRQGPANPGPVVPEANDPGDQSPGGAGDGAPTTTAPVSTTTTPTTTAAPTVSATPPPTQPTITIPVPTAPTVVLPPAATPGASPQAAGGAVPSVADLHASTGPVDLAVGVD
jgi:hypothetical protein